MKHESFNSTGPPNYSHVENELVKHKEEEMFTTSLVTLDKYIISPDIAELDGRIDSLMEKKNGIWTCKPCGKTCIKKSGMTSHIEGMHIEGISHPCQACGKTFRSRNSLTNHKSITHTKNFV